MNLGMLVNVVSCFVIVYLFIKFNNTRKFIYKLPIMTRSKYLGLESLSKKIIIVNTVLLIVSILVPIFILKLLFTAIIVLTTSYGVSELDVLKSYVSKKKK